MGRNQSNARTGIWITGALGDIATTLSVGLCAMRRGLAPPTGMVTALDAFADTDLVPLDELAVGGVDIREGSLRQMAQAVGQSSRTWGPDLLAAVEADLAAMEADIVCEPGAAWDILETPAPDVPALGEIVETLRAHIRQFRERNGLDRVVAVNLTSSGPLPADDPAHHRLELFHQAVADNRRDVITPAMLSACAAFLEGCAHVNFTPNVCTTIGALRELAERRGLPYAGNDGKTGETLVKTALAPMFAQRNLRVMSWEGTNMLGNGDGRSLDDPDNRAGKLRNKEGVLGRMLGYPVHSGVSINYVPSLGDWKTAWDLIHFEGFLGVPMSMQFTWQGCDSILAAPLVIDMARLSDLALQDGQRGTMRHLACFFKDPMDVDEMALGAQFGMLLKHLHERRDPSARPSTGTAP